MEDIDDVSEEIEEEVEEELGLDSQDDDVDYLESLRISWMTLTSTQRLTYVGVVLSGGSPLITSPRSTVFFSVTT